MEINDDKITELACAALRQMLEKNGPHFTFPADVIWQYVTENIDIPSTAKPHQPKKLLKNGWLVKTGRMVKAQSEARAGSATTEYGFGPFLIGSPEYGVKEGCSLAKPFLLVAGM